MNRLVASNLLLAVLALVATVGLARKYWPTDVHPPRPSLTHLIFRP